MLVMINFVVPNNNFLLQCDHLKDDDDLTKVKLEPQRVSSFDTHHGVSRSMSRQRQSSVTSVLKSTGQNGHIDSPASPYTTSQRLTQTASTSQIPKLPFQLSTIPSQNSETSLEREADELFAHKTIAEVKIVQTQLRYLVNLNMEHAYDEIVTRSDAEAKQEELRLMVGLVIHF